MGLVFAVNGLAFASWASRTPGVKAGLQLDASGLGLLLVCLSVGAMASMPLTGAVVHHAGPARAVLSGAGAEATGFLFAAWGLGSGSVWLTGLGLFVAGLGISVWDVSMNVEGAAVERRLGRTIMSRFHAGWSLGSVLGAALGALAAAAGVGVSTQMVATAVIVIVLALLATAWFTPVPASTEEEPTSRSLALKAWKTPRTLVVGLMVLAFAFSEGVANDWTAVAFVDGLGSSEATGAIAFGVFVAAMTLARLLGVGVIDRWGRVLVLRAAAVVAAAGVVLVVVGPGVAWAMLGALLWGAGTALGFPTGISAAADHSRSAAMHVSVVSSIGYTAFLAGPPLVGYLGDLFGVRQSLYVVLVALVLALATIWAARPLTPRQDASEA